MTLSCLVTERARLLQEQPELPTLATPRSEHSLLKRSQNLSPLLYLIVIVLNVRWFDGSALIIIILRSWLFSLLLGSQLLDDCLFAVAILFSVEPVIN